MTNKVLVIYTAPKVGDIIWQLPFVKAISDHHNTKVTFAFNDYIQIGNLLLNTNYIEKVFKNRFRKGIKYFLYDLIKFIILLKKNHFDYIYILDKTKLPAIAAKISGVKNILSFGIGSQKLFLTNKFFLSKNDLRMNYPSLSKKFLDINNISISNLSPQLNINSVTLHNFVKKFFNLPRPWTAMGIDSLEDNRIWSPKNFRILAEELYSRNLSKTFFLICHKNKKYLSEEIIKNSTMNKINFVDCSSMNLNEIIDVISSVDLFIGNDSGPCNLSVAFGKKTFCIIGPTDASALQSDKLVKITSKVYDISREKGIKRHGDNFDQTNKEINSIKVSEVLQKVIEFSN